MKVQHIIGADISKKTIDFATDKAVHIKVENTPVGFGQLYKWLKEQHIKSTEVMIVMEHTGLYSYQLEQFLHRHKMSFTKVPALVIKRSMGLVRGKNDKVDAIRIARFGKEKQQSLVAAAADDPTLQRLQLLHSTRETLVSDRAAYLSAVKEYQQTLALKSSDTVICCRQNIIKEFTAQIKIIDEQIATLIASQQVLKDNFELLQSITGVGKVVAVATLIKTGNFSRFTDARKFACYCGTAPFEHRSGTSIRGRTRVSHLADKKMKSLLDLAAKTAIQHDSELKEYYLRKTTEGKPKMSTINVVRNKILYRMFAVIKRQTPFMKDYLQAS